MDSMNLRDLQYIVALAEHLHFGRAAEACFVSQPTLSTQVRKLEEELGVTLFERSARQVLCTEVGADIVARAREVLNEADQIRATARRARDPESGTLRLGIFPTLAPYLLPHVVPLVRERFTRLELLLVEEKTDVLLQRLRDGKLDAAILALPVDSQQLQVRHLFNEPFVLATPLDHPLASRTRLDTSDLDGHNVLLLDDGHCLRDQALEVCELAGATEKSGFRATSMETLRQMVAANVGITLLPILAVQPPIAQSRHVQIVPFRNPPHREIAMLWRMSSAAGAFLEQLADVFAALPAQILDPSTIPAKQPTMVASASAATTP